MTINRVQLSATLNRTTMAKIDALCPPNMCKSKFVEELIEAALKNKEAAETEAAIGENR